MIVLQQNRRYLRWMGLYPRHADQTTTDALDIVHNILYMSTMTITLGAQIMNFVANISDVKKATEALYPIFGAGTQYCIYWLFVTRKFRARCIFDELQSIVDQSLSVISISVHSSVTDFCVCIPQASRAPTGRSLCTPKDVWRLPPNTSQLPMLWQHFCAFCVRLRWLRLHLSTARTTMMCGFFRMKYREFGRFVFFFFTLELQNLWFFEITKDTVRTEDIDWIRGYVGHSGHQRCYGHIYSCLCCVAVFLHLLPYSWLVGHVGFDD